MSIKNPKTNEELIELVTAFFTAIGLSQVAAKKVDNPEDTDLPSIELNDFLCLWKQNSDGAPSWILDAAHSHWDRDSGPQTDYSTLNQSQNLYESLRHASKYLIQEKVDRHIERLVMEEEATCRAIII